MKTICFMLLVLFACFFAYTILDRENRAKERRDATQQIEDQKLKDAQSTIRKANADFKADVDSYRR